MFTLSRKIHHPLAWLACAVTVLLFAAPAQAVVTHTIDSDGDVELFIQAIQTPNARVTIAGHVNLDVSSRQDLYIAPGVQIIGDQSVYPAGPRIFSGYPHPESASYLFLIGDEWRSASDNVRITGIRFDGGAGNEHSNKVGISIRSSINVEIDHCEFRGWGRAAIEVLDPTGNRITLANASTVHVHDNYIHDNQNPGGYGVVTGKGAYALIEQNVFFSNRHSIAGDGSDGSGYLVYRNLELANNGFNSDEQQIDMHGQLDCGGAHANCGPAGEYMDIRYNTVQHVRGRSFHLRGKPSIRADVAYNVFALPRYAALKQNEGENLHDWDNKFELNTYDEEKYCDFDADGIVDRFMATGATWWYRSSLVGRWTYLNQSVERASSLTLRDATADGRCDVIAHGVVFRSGMSAMRGTDVLWRQSNGLQPLTWQLATDGNVYRTRFSPLAILVNDRVLGTGDFDGDGDSDVLVSSASGQVHRVLMEDGSGVRDKPVSWTGIAFAGAGDFDGDGADDVLWRLPDGRLHLWFSAMNGRSAWVSWANQGGTLENAWQIKGVADFNVDGRADILFRHTNGSLAIWLMNGGSWIADLHPTGVGGSPTAWEISGVGDFNGDRRADILWRSFLGSLAITQAVGSGIVHPTYRNEPGRPVEVFWKIKGVADFNADGKADIFWHNINTGLVGFWTMNGGIFMGEFYPGNDSGGAWKIEGFLPLRDRASEPTPGNNAILIPDLTGYTLNQAAQELGRLGLSVGAISEQESCDYEGEVASQQPGSVRVAPGTLVNLWLGKRPPPPRSCL